MWRSDNGGLWDVRTSTFLSGLLAQHEQMGLTAARLWGTIKQDALRLISVQGIECLVVYPETMLGLNRPDDNSTYLKSLIQANVLRLVERV